MLFIFQNAQNNQSVPKNNDILFSEKYEQKIALLTMVQLFLKIKQ